jgi:hypothetical protein
LIELTFEYGQINLPAIDKKHQNSVLKQRIVGKINSGRIYSPVLKAKAEIAE